jgi:hypothetical protein
VVCAITGKPDALFQTSYVKDMQDPVWNEEHDLDDFVEGDKLRFTIMDYEAGEEGEPLGMTELSTIAFLRAAKDPQTGFEEEVQLSSRNGDKARLHLRIYVKIPPMSPEEIAELEEIEAEWKAECEKRTSSKLRLSSKPRLPSKEEPDDGVRKSSKTVEDAVMKFKGSVLKSRDKDYGTTDADRRRWERERRQRKQAEEERRRLVEHQERVARENEVRRREEAEKAARQEAARLAALPVDVAIHLYETGEYLCRANAIQGDTIRSLGENICQLMTLPGRLVLRSEDGTRLANDSTLADAGVADYPRVSIEMGQILATASEDCTVRIWDVETGQCELVMRGHEGCVYHVAFGSKCRYIITSSEDKTARLWSLITGRCDKTFRGHQGAVFFSAISNDMAHLATCSDDCTAKVWVWKTGLCHHTLTGHSSTVVNATFSEDNETITTVSRDLTSRIWSVKTGACQRVVQLQAQGHSYDVSFSTTGLTFAVNLGGNYAEVFNVEKGKREVLLEGHEDLVTWSTFSPATPELLRLAIDHERERQAEAAKIRR